jgi:hypothetical protein
MRIVCSCVIKKHHSKKPFLRFRWMHIKWFWPENAIWFIQCRKTITWHYLYIKLLERFFSIFVYICWYCCMKTWFFVIESSCSQIYLVPPSFTPRGKHSLMFRRMEGRAEGLHPKGITSPLGLHYAPRGHYVQLPQPSPYKKIDNYAQK